MGTPIYMSPEQCKGGKTVGDRADVYAPGVMLFEDAVGRIALYRRGARRIHRHAPVKDPPLIGSLVENLLPKLRLLVDSMLIKDPQKRPAMPPVAMVLRDLSNVSTDVKSMADLLQEGNLDDDAASAQSAGAGQDRVRPANGRQARAGHPSGTAGQAAARHSHPGGAEAAL